MTLRRWMALLLVVPLLAGCASPADGPQPADAQDTGVARVPQAVVAIVDSGINAYHHGFRDPSPLAWTHPSLYIDGYPSNATALRLTLDAPDWEAAVAADCEAWNGLQPRTLYWVPGTRIIGLWLDLGWEERTVDCAAGERPLKGLDTLSPHGSGAAGRAAGAATSLCPDCRVVMTQMGQNTWAMDWASRQPWIDLQSNSWAGYEHDMLPGQDGRGPRELAREATARQVTFAGSGNGMREYVGTPFGTYGASWGLGIPAYLRPAQGQPGVLVVGGHDNGEAVLWPGTMPHVVADVEDHPSTAWNGLEGGIFNGTSGSTPFAAGAFARMVLEARRLAGDLGTGLRGGDLVVARNGAALPASGPLSDGRLSREEAESAFRHTAVARPVEELPYDGGIGCPPVDCDAIGTVTRGYSLGPWSTVPEAVPAYYYVGYGQVGVASLAAATAVLRGEAPEPERPTEDEAFGLDGAVRGVLVR